MKRSVKSKTIEFNDEEDLINLKQRIMDEAPESGSQSIYNNELTFDSYPLSGRTLAGLKEAKLFKPTEIQAAAIPHTLIGRDILGAAKTGSGKTLSFVIPLLEKLFMERWSSSDGLGAVILTPTRELALQIFDVLRLVGKKHLFSAGLITGGKKEFEEEQARVIRMNILVATPGRFLQHLEQTSGFDASQLQILVLDEADRILDMGFKQQLDGIMDYLPPRQTLLFSATQTKSVKDLARLSLNDPEYLSVHEAHSEVTPAKLIQNYVVCKLEDKLDTLFSFLKSHLKSKIIVFFSTCSQVRFVFECFRSMQPGIPLTALHGKIKQERRTIIFMDYVKRTHACLFCTDIASRGLDFPSVDWVVQVDAPEDTAMYIHRVGRTARYDADGKALLMLLPQEEKRVAATLQQAMVPIKKLSVNPNHRVSVSSHASALLVSQPEVRLLAKKAFTGYMRSLQLLPTFEKAEFSKLNLDAFSASLGLAVTPSLPASETDGEDGREANRDRKNVNRSLDKLKRQIKEAKDAKRKAREESKTASAKSTNSKTSEFNTGDSSDDDNDDDDDGDVLVAKKSQSWLGVSDEIDFELSNDKASQSDKSTTRKKKDVKLKIQADDVAKPMRIAGSKKVKFDEEGEAVPEFTLTSLKQLSGTSTDESEQAIQKNKILKHSAYVKARLDRSRQEDQERDKERVRDLHRKRRLSDKPVREDAEEDAYGVQLAVGGFNEEDHSQDGDESVDYSSSEEEIELPPAKVSKKKKQKTKREINDDDDEDGDNQDIDEQERLALQFLNR